MAVAEVFNMLRQRHLHEFISMAMRVCKYLSVALKASDGMVDVDADRLGVVSKLPFFPVAVAEHDADFMALHGVEHIVAADVTKVNDAFSTS